MKNNKPICWQPSDDSNIDKTHYGAYRGPMLARTISIITIFYISMITYIERRQKIILFILYTVLYC